MRGWLTVLVILLPWLMAGATWLLTHVWWAAVIMYFAAMVVQWTLLRAAIQWSDDHG